MKLDVSLYIPVYNGESTIESVLKSVFELDPGPNEIIVINDGSTDNTANILKNYEKNITIVKNEKNMGLAFSRNLGLSKSKNENVASIDSDVEVSKNWLKHLYDVKNNFKSAISGAMLIEKYNLKEGKNLGQKLKKIEDLWINNSFQINNKDIEKIINN